MATKINVNVSGFDAVALRERAQQNTSTNRLRQEELSQQQKTAKQALDAAKKRKVSPGLRSPILSGGRFVPEGFTDEYVPGGSPGPEIFYACVSFEDQASSENVPILRNSLAFNANLSIIDTEVVTSTKRVFTITPKGGENSVEFEFVADTGNSFPQRIGQQRNISNVEETPQGTYTGESTYSSVIGNPSFIFLESNYAILPIDKNRSVLLVETAYTINIVVATFNVFVSSSSEDENSMMPSPDQTEWPVSGGSASNIYSDWHITDVSNWSNNTTYKVERRAFFCTEGQVTEIPLPSTTSQVLENRNPSDPEKFSYEYGIIQNAFRGFPSFIEFFNQYDPNPLLSISFDKSDGFSPIYAAQRALETFTPSVYLGFDYTDIPAASGFLFKEFRNSRKKWILPDTSSGYFSSPPSESVYVLRYKEWPIPGAAPFDPQGVVQVVPQPKATANIPLASDFPPDPRGLAGCWNWGDAAYCVSACRMLGFSV